MKKDLDDFPLEGAVTDKQICAFRNICKNTLTKKRQAGIYPPGVMDGRKRYSEAAEIRAAWARELELGKSEQTKAAEKAAKVEAEKEAKAKAPRLEASHV